MIDEINTGTPEATSGETEGTTEETTVTETTSDDAESLDALKESIKKLETANKGLLERAKAAELKAKTKRADLQTPDVPQTENVDERILKAQGMNDDLLKELKRVARFNEIDLISAQNDPMFVSIKQKYEQEQRDKEASLGVSRGSGQSKAPKTFTSTDLSAEEHKELWKKKVGL